MAEEIGFSAARGKALEMLQQVEAEAGVAVAFFSGEFGVPEHEDRADVWLFNWNSVEYIRSGDFFDQLLAGPIAVPKDGGEAFFLGTALPVDEDLERWRKFRARG